MTLVPSTPPWSSPDWRWLSVGIGTVANVSWMTTGFASPAQAFFARSVRYILAASGLPDRSTNSRTRSNAFRLRVGGFSAASASTCCSSRTACGVDSSGMFAQPATTSSASSSTA